MQKITVVTVARNVCQALRQTMDSVLQQDYENVEYIVVDGASTDGTVSMLESVDCPYLKWISEPDSGIYNAMNKAIGMATGEYVIFMNAGDLFAGDDVLSRVFEKPEQADIIYGHVEKKDKQGVWQVKKQNSPITATACFSVISLALSGENYCNATALMRDTDIPQISNSSRHSSLPVIRLYLKMLS